MDRCARRFFLCVSPFIRPRRKFITPALDWDFYTMYTCTIERKDGWQNRKWDFTREREIRAIKAETIGWGGGGGGGREWPIFCPVQPLCALEDEREGRGRA